MVRAKTTCQRRMNKIPKVTLVFLLGIAKLAGSASLIFLVDCSKKSELFICRCYQWNGILSSAKLSQKFYWMNSFLFWTRIILSLLCRDADFCISWFVKRTMKSTTRKLSLISFLSFTKLFQILVGGRFFPE